VVVARGLGGLPADRQLAELKAWFQAMAAHLPAGDGVSAVEREQRQQALDQAVLVV
jgi:hypothetical protein